MGSAEKDIKKALRKNPAGKVVYLATRAHVKYAKTLLSSKQRYKNLRDALKDIKEAIWLLNIETDAGRTSLSEELFAQGADLPELKFSPPRYKMLLDGYQKLERNVSESLNKYNKKRRK